MSKPKQVKPGDLIQWECNGAYMFAPLAKVTNLSPCSKYCFVEGTNTGIPIDQIVEIQRPEPKFSAKYRDFSSKLVEYYGRLVIREGSDKWGFCLRTVERWSRMLKTPNLEEAAMLKKSIGNYKLGPAWNEFVRAISEWIDEVTREQETTNPNSVPK